MMRFRSTKAAYGKRKEVLQTIAWVNPCRAECGSRSDGIMSDRPEPRRIPAHDLETIKFCVAAAWHHGAISDGRALELAETLHCSRAELATLVDEVKQEQG